MLQKPQPIALRLANLEDLPPSVKRPAYARADLSPGIVHIGVGNFHRAHQAVSLDTLFNRGQDLDWAIIGASVRRGDSAMRDRLLRQDCLTTVVELEPAANAARVTGAMIDFAPIEAKSLIETLCRPQIRIVSLTITEGGYFLDAAGAFNAAHEDIAHDAANPEQPRTVFGILVAAVAKRRDAGLPPFTIMSCDNIPGNGDVARSVVTGMAGLQSGPLAQWIDGHIAFPNSMVDRITPATGDRERALVRDEFLIADECPVVCEAFHQWVIEDQFSAGRPSLEDVGVTFSDNVAAYELMKLRILNGGHAAIAYPGALMGFTYAHEAMAEPLIAGFMQKLARTEAIPTLPAIPGVDFDAYLALIAERFANPKIGDKIARLCEDGSNRQPKFILPTIVDRLAAGQPVDGLALEVALWCRYCAAAGEDPGGEPLNDPRREKLKERARAAKAEPGAFLAMNDVFGELAQRTEFMDAFAAALAKLWSLGVEQTLAAYLNE